MYETSAVQANIDFMYRATQKSDVSSWSDKTRPIIWMSDQPSQFYEKQKSKQHTSSNFSRILFISSKILPHKNNWSLWRLYVRCLAFSNTFSHHQDVLLSESLSYFAYKRFNVIVLFIRSFLYVKLCLGITKLYI